MRETLIFSKQWKQEDILKILKFEETSEDWYDKNDYDFEEENDKKINLEEYTDLSDKFVSEIKQEELESLNNDINKII